MGKTLLVYDSQANTVAAKLEGRSAGVEILVAPDRETALRLAPRASALMLLDTHLDAEVLKAASGLEWIQTLTTGTDHITRVPGFTDAITLTTARGIHGPQMSELAFFLMLSLLRDAPRLAANQKAHQWERWPQALLWRKTVAVLGVGAIAEDFAKRAKAFDMTVIGISGSPRPAPFFDEMRPRSDLPAAVADADFLVVFIPLSAETEKLVNGEVFKAMKPSAYLINLARGGVVDEAALLEALSTGKIAGAGLDVFSTEPLPASSPIWEAPNAMLTPHIGGFADVIIDQGLSVLIANLELYATGNAAQFANVVRAGRLVPAA